MIYRPKPWDWPQEWYKDFVILRATSKTYVKVDEFFIAKRKWITDKIFNRYLFWHTIKFESRPDQFYVESIPGVVSLELLNWLCKDNTNSKWTLSLKYKHPADRRNNCLIFIFYFKKKSDLLLFKMRW